MACASSLPLPELPLPNATKVFPTMSASTMKIAGLAVLALLPYLATALNCPPSKLHVGDLIGKKNEEPFGLLNPKGGYKNIHKVTGLNRKLEQVYVNDPPRSNRHMYPVSDWVFASFDNHEFWKKYERVQKYESMGWVKDLRPRRADESLYY